MYIDLTMELSEKTPPFPGDPKLETRTIATIKKDCANEQRISLNSHFGTHIDAPFHMLTDGKTLNEFPIETFIGEAGIIDVREFKKIKRIHLPKFGRIPIVFFFTNHTKKVFGKDFFRNNPVILPETAKELIKRRVKIVGIDSFTPDNYPYTVHKILFKENILIVENLVNLDMVGLRCKIFIAPLNLKNADGSPARVIAEVKNGK